MPSIRRTSVRLLLQFRRSGAWFEAQVLPLLPSGVEGSSWHVALSSSSRILQLCPHTRHTGNEVQHRPASSDCAYRKLGTASCACYFLSLCAGLSDLQDPGSRIRTGPHSLRNPLFKPSSRRRSGAFPHA